MWAVLSGAAQGERAVKAMDAVDEYLYTGYEPVIKGCRARPKAEWSGPMTNWQ